MWMKKPLRKGSALDAFNLVSVDGNILNIQVESIGEAGQIGHHKLHQSQKAKIHVGEIAGGPEHAMVRNQ